MQSLILFAVLTSAIVSFVGACSSSISKRPSRPSHPAPAPQITVAPPTVRNNITFPTYKCQHPYSEYYCLNDAKCFIIVIQDSPLYNCECKDGFVGQRCEYKDLENSYVLMSRRLMMETASIAGGATVAVFLAILVCFGAWVRLHRRGKESRKEEEERGTMQLVAVQSGARCVHVVAGEHYARSPPPPYPTAGSVATH